MTPRSAITATLLTVILALGGSVATAPLASAAPTLEITPGFFGSDYIGPTLITVGNCDDRAVFSGATYKIIDAEGAVADSGAAKDEFGSDGRLVSRRIFSTVRPGVYTAEVTCLRYHESAANLPALDTTRKEFVVVATGLLLKSGDPIKGGQVTFWSVGQLDTGEQVKLVLTDETGTITVDKNGYTVGETREGKVLKTWPTTATVGPNKVWSFAIADFPVLDPKRAYQVSAVGLTSGKRTSGSFGPYEARMTNGLPSVGN